MALLQDSSSSKQENRVLVLSTVAFTLNFAVWLMLGVLAVPIRDELGLSKLQFTWLTAIAVLSGSIFRLPLGLLTDRYGGRKLMTLLTLVTAVPCYLLSTANSYTETMLYALCFGIAGNTFSIGIAWNAAWFSRERQGFALGTFGAGAVGASITKLIGPTLIALLPAAGLFGGAIAGGWRFVPVLYSVLLVSMAACLWWLSPTPERTPGAGRLLRSMLTPLRELRVWRFGLYYVVVFGAYVALALWLPNYYRSVYGFSLARAALLTALFIFPACLSCSFGGYLSDKLGPRPVTYGVFAAMLLSCIPLVMRGTGSTTLFVCIEVLGIAMGIGKGSVLKYISEYYPRDVGLVGGLVGTLGALGGFFLPLGFGYLEAATGRPESCFWIMLGLILCTFAWLHRVVLSIRRDEFSLAGRGAKLSSCRPGGSG